MASQDPALLFPRQDTKESQLENGVEYLSIFDENGKLEPDIDDDRLQQIVRTMLLARRFDERLLTLQRQGRTGTFAPVRGQEAGQIGALAALFDSDWFVHAFREFAAMLWRGFPLALGKNPHIVTYITG